VHSGYDHSPEGQCRKRERDLRLLQLELQERPDHPFTLFNLGMTYADMGRHEQAVEALRRSLEHSDPHDSQVRKAYALLVGSCRQLGRHEEAWEVCQRGRAIFPDDPELLFLEGILNHHYGRHQEAEASYHRLLQGREGKHFSSIDTGILGFKAHQNLAVLYADMGEWSKAEGEWRRVVEELPEYAPGWRGLGAALLEQGKLTEAEQLAASMMGRPPLRGEGIALRARTQIRLGKPEEAAQQLREALAEQPASVEPLRVLCEVLYHHGTLEEAEEALRQLVQLDPEDASARHNLGTVYLRMGRHDDAAQALQESVRLRPDSPATWAQLAHALSMCGRHEEAAAAEQRAASQPAQGPAGASASRGTPRTDESRRR